MKLMIYNNLIAILKKIKVVKKEKYQIRGIKMSRDVRCNRLKIINLTKILEKKIIKKKNKNY